MSQPAEPVTPSSPRKSPPRIVKTQGLPLRWIIFSVVIVHLGVLILFGSQSDKILRKQEPVKPQNFYHAEEVYEVNAGRGEELVRVREYTVSTKLYPRNELPDEARQLPERELPVEQVEPVPANPPAISIDQAE